MKHGWRPKFKNAPRAPIPLYYEFDSFSIPIDPETKKPYEPIYLGPRYKNSLIVHKKFAN